jgi:hypothetical protein
MAPIPGNELILGEESKRALKVRPEMAPASSSDSTGNAPNPAQSLAK